MGAGWGAGTLLRVFNLFWEFEPFHEFSKLRDFCKICDLCSGCLYNQLSGSGEIVLCIACFA